MTKQTYNIIGDAANVTKKNLYVVVKLALMAVGTIWTMMIEMRPEMNLAISMSLHNKSHQ